MRLPVAEVAAAFQLGEPTAPALPAKGGLLHRVWRLETQRGRFAVKMLVPPAGLDEADWMSDYERSFDLERPAVEAGFPTAAPVAARDGAWLAHVRGGTVRVHRWVSGDRLPDRDLSADVAARAGALMAEIHALGIVRETAPESVLPTRPIDYWRSLEADVPELRGIAAVHEAVNSELLTARELVVRPVLGHRDVNAKNLLRTEAGGLALLDWELSGPVEPALEAAAAALDWAGAFWWEPDPAVAAAFLGGYVAAGGTFPDQPDRRYLAYWLETVSEFAITSHRRALFSSTSGEKLRARRNASFTVSQLRRGLEAAGRWTRLLVPAPC